MEPNNELHEAEPSGDVHVEIEQPPAPDPTPEPVEQDAPVVVVDSGSDGVPPEVTRLLVEQAAQIEQLRAEAANATSVADSAQATAEVAAGSVADAIGEVQQVAAEVSATISENKDTPVAEDDQDPAHAEHGWYRKRGHHR